MKVLWFNISTPSGYNDIGRVTTGWQDSLEEILKKVDGIELMIAFETDVDSAPVTKNGVTYIPMFVKYSRYEKYMGYFTWSINENKLIPKCIDVIETYKPDIIHVFGNEWPFGLVANYTSIPVVVHIQGSIIPYYNALYPPKYSFHTIIQKTGFNIRQQYQNLKDYMREKSRLNMEKRIWKAVKYYMGRTEWDKALVNTIPTKAYYFHVDEALRQDFINPSCIWEPSHSTKIRIISTGCTSFWKGIDMLLKTAHILKNNNIDFEWKVCGYLPNYLKRIVEKKEGLSFKDNNVEVLGFTPSKELANLLCKSDVYVHSAYIENSPNSICEAQCLGIPIISTNVGGISTLVKNEEEGILVPANDPWQMAYQIIKLASDNDRKIRLSEASKKHAQYRHNSENIIKQLLNCYNEIININEKKNS